jgi:hypothetical protein
MTLTQSDKIQFTLRLDSNIYNKIKSISEVERRSLNSQIEYLLEKCIQEYDKSMKDPPSNG